MPPIPIIEVESVRMALEAMRQAEPLAQANPLALFISIGRSTAQIGGTAASDTLIFRHLANLIRHRLNQHRSLYNLPAALPYSDALGVQDDFRVGNSELEAWSILYYRYVRIDLDLSLDQLESITSQDKRTLHRRQSKGLARLTHDLTRHELRVRTRHRKRQLRAQLPLPYTPKITGRKVLIAEALEWLNAPQSPRHLLIDGAPGVGKTTLALALAHHLIDQEAVENVVWIDQPEPQHQTLLEQIALRLGLTFGLDTWLETGAALSAYLQTANTLVILDSAQNLVAHMPMFDAIMRTLGAARLLICVHGLPEDRTGRIDVARLHVPDLDQEAALDVLSQHARRLGKRVSIEQLEQMYQDIGGNSRALRMALSAGRHYNTPLISADLYRAVWDSLPYSARLAWLILGLRPSQTTEADMLRLLPGPPLVTLAALSRHSVVEESDTGTVTLLPLTRAYAEIAMQDDTQRIIALTAVRAVADDLIEHSDPIATIHLLVVIQRVHLPVALRLDLAYAFAPVVERVGVWSMWHSYLESLHDEVSGKDRFWVGLHIGTALRWLAQWGEAAYALTEVMQSAGRAGDFMAQSDAMTELVVVYRNQERRELAEQLLQRADSFYRRTRHAEGIERVAAEYILMALDAGDLRLAQHTLEHVGESLSPRLLNLAALVALRLDDPTAAFRFAQAAQRELADDTPRLARTLALIGQIQYRLGNSAIAVNYLIYAASIMEETHDLLGHARARLNLAAIYLGRGNLRTALRYLHNLPADLERLGDTASLEIALKNLQVINEVSKRWLNKPRQA